MGRGGDEEPTEVAAAPVEEGLEAAEIVTKVHRSDLSAAMEATALEVSVDVGASGRGGRVCVWFRGSFHGALLTKSVL